MEGWLGWLRHMNGKEQYYPPARDRFLEKLVFPHAIPVSDESWWVHEDCIH